MQATGARFMIPEAWVRMAESSGVSEGFLNVKRKTFHTTILRSPYCTWLVASKGCALEPPVTPIGSLRPYDVAGQPASASLRNRSPETPAGSTGLKTRRRASSRYPTNIRPVREHMRLDLSAVASLPADP